LATTAVIDGDDEMAGRLYPRVRVLRERAELIRNRGLSVFRDDIAFCSPDEQHCIVLVHIRPGGRKFQQGHPVPLTLDWVTEGPAPSSLQVRLRVLHNPWLPWARNSAIVSDTVRISEGMRSVASRESHAELAEMGLAETSPITRSFQATLPLVLGGVAAQTHDGRYTVPVALTLPLGAQTGRAVVLLDVLGPDGCPWHTSAGHQTLRLFTLTVQGRPVLHRLPSGLIDAQADLGDAISLRGYKVEGDARPGQALRITYAWYARKRPTAIYAVFNHLTTSDGAIAAQVDGWPLEGRLLTTHWESREYVLDRYRLVIPPEAPPGPYTLYTGMYDAGTGARQPAFAGGVRLAEDRIVIPLPDGADGR
jgi:hypothetical protein